MQASRKKLIAKLLSSFLFTLAILLTGLGFIPTAFAITAATVTVPTTVQIQANSATTNVTGVSVSGLSGTILVAVNLSNFPANAVLKLPTTTGLTASFGFTSGSNTFASFTNISFTGAIADVNTALAALQYVSGATGTLNPTVKVTATTSDTGVALNGYNGHFYKSSSPTTAYYTTAGSGARAAAKASTYKGQSGYVVTITSDNENTFVSTAIESAANIWIGATDELVEGVWRWDTSGGSPEAGTIFWNGVSTGSSPAGQWAKWSSGEPNDYGGAEDYAVTNWGGGIAWNDCGDACGIGAKYVIEYGTNAADGGFVNALSDLGSGTFTLSYNPILTGTTANLSVTFGSAGYDTVTATSGTGTKTFALTSSPTDSGITINTSVTNQAILTVASSVAGGTYYETITATDAASVTATFLITVMVSYPPSSDTDSAMVFNGSTQYATASGDVAGFDIANAISIEAWIYPTGASCNGNLVGKATSYFIYCVSGVLSYAMGGASAWSGVSTGITIPVNQWSHIALTRAESTAAANIYIDGKLQYSGTADGAGTAALTNSSNLFNIGARDAGATFFPGQIDEVKLWNVARSASDVVSDLKTYGGTLASGLVGYYDFNDLYGTYLVNRSTNGSGTLNLTVANSPTLSASAISTTTTSSPYSITRFARNYLVAANGWKSPSTSKIKYLIVAGGGGGGAGYEGGGGGAGGYLESTTSISANTYYPIVVGVGGRGGLKKYGPTNGETSTAFSITAFGGGRGGTEQSGMSGPDASTALNGAARQSGGSGGGGSHGSYTDVTGASGTSGQGSSGGAGLSNGAQFVGGGGGGASAIGGSASVSAPGSGGAGKTSTITGSSVNLAGGGGGSGRSTSSLVGTASFGGGAGAIDTGTFGTTNTGGGGGASTGSVYGISTGGSGGSGLVVLRYLTSNPSINLQPTNDTTTAGLTDSMTVGTTTISSPFSKSVKWQVATDTLTAVASVSWSDVASGTGFTTDTFTTATLTTDMNKFRYRAIVTFSDSDSLTVVETSTVATLTINPAITITSIQTTITNKYGTSGTTRTVTHTGGTDTRTVSASSLSLASGKITFDTTTARFTIETRTAVGTYYDTITVTDVKGATASYVQTITNTVADTLTVTSDTPTALTYTGSQAVITPSLTTISGLVSGDVISGVTTYTYSATALSCANGGPCSIGQTGPGGGLIFITPTTTGNTTGKYFEAAPSGWSGSGTDPLGKYCVVPSFHSGAQGTAIGTGQANTLAMATDCVSIADTATALILNGKNDWFIPSLDELKEMYTSLYKATPTSLGGFTGVNYWSSSDHPTTAGYALQGWFGATDGSTGWGLTDEANSFSYRPVRSFVATSTSTVNYGPSTTKPTGAGTYVITPSALTFSSGAASNYAAITYLTSTLTINKAAQTALTITPLYNVFNGNPTTAILLTTGGTDTGTVTYAYVASGSSASGCALSGINNSVVTVTSVGTCRIVATKAATDNYLVITSDTGTVTFYQYVTNFPVPRAAAYPVEIVLNSSTPWTSNGLAPTITASGIDFTAKSPTGVFTISGTGFVGTRLVRVSGTNAAFTVLSDTSLQITMPSGLVGISGPIYVEKAEGSRVSEDWVTGTA